jgi:hypothetical protein
MRPEDTVVEGGRQACKKGGEAAGERMGTKGKIPKAKFQKPKIPNFRKLKQRLFGAVGSVWQGGLGDSGPQGWRRERELVLKKRR